MSSLRKTNSTTEAENLEHTNHLYVVENENENATTDSTDHAVKISRTSTPNHDVDAWAQHALASNGFGG